VLCAALAFAPHDLEARCSEFCKAVETRVAKLEKEIQDKASVSQLTKLETDIKGKALTILVIHFFLVPLTKSDHITNLAQINPSPRWCLRLFLLLHPPLSTPQCHEL
jgi:hypothetical protein